MSVATSNAPDMSIADVRFGFVDSAGGEPVLIYQTDGKYQDFRAAPWVSPSLDVDCHLLVGGAFEHQRWRFHH